MKKDFRIIYSNPNKNGVQHSNYYHKYFAGYAEYYDVTIDKKGKKVAKLKRLYVSDYYKMDVSDNQWILRRALYVLLFFFSLAIFLLCASRNVPVNMEWYVAIMCFASVITYFLLFFNLFPFLITPRIMKEFEYRSTTEGVVRYSLAGAVANIFEAASALAYLILNYRSFCWSSVFVMIGFVVSAAMLYAINRLELATDYVTVENSAQAPDNSVVIKWEKT